MKNLITIALVFVMAFALFVGAKSAYAALLSYDSSIQVQNLEATPASITISFYNRDGSPALSVTDTVAASSSNTYFPLQDIGDPPGDVPAGFDGSVVVSSDKQIAAVTNVVGSNGTDSMAYGASYKGFNGGAPSLNVPLLMKGNFGYNTWFSVQNVGSSPTVITATYSDIGAVAASNNPVQPGAAAKFDQSAEGHAAGWVGSAVVTSSASDIALTALEVGPTTLFAYNSFSSGDPNPIFPLVNENNFGYVTGINIQNASGTDTDVRVDFTATLAGTSCFEERIIPANSSLTFGFVFTNFADAGHLVAENCNQGETFVGAGKVTSNSTNAELVGIVNQLNAGGNKGAAYGSFQQTDGTASVLFPLLMDRNFGYFTGISVVNVGDNPISAGALNCTFVGNSLGGPINTARSNPNALAQGQSWTFVMNGQIGDHFVGSGTCVGPGGSQIVGIVNELKSSGGLDTFLVYEGVNQ